VVWEESNGYENDEGEDDKAETLREWMPRFLQTFATNRAGWRGGKHRNRHTDEH